MEVMCMDGTISLRNHHLQPTTKVRNKTNTTGKSKENSFLLISLGSSSSFPPFLLSTKKKRKEKEQEEKKRQLVLRSYYPVSTYLLMI